MRKIIFGVVVSVLLVSLGLNVKAAEEKTEAFVWKEEDEKHQGNDGHY